MTYQQLRKKSKNIIFFADKDFFRILRLRNILTTKSKCYEKILFIIDGSFCCFNGIWSESDEQKDHIVPGEKRQNSTNQRIANYLGKRFIERC